MNETDKMLEEMMKALEKPEQSPQKTIEKPAKTLQNKTTEKSGDEIGPLLTDLKKQKSSKDFVFIDCSNEKNLDSFYICNHQVTQNEFEDVMGINPSWFQLSNTKLDNKQREQLQKEGSTENHPVERVSWYDAIYYCNKRSIIEGLEPVYSVDGKTDIKSWRYRPCIGHNINRKITEKPDSNGYRLPKAKEWEYAAKGGKKFKYAGSNNIDEVAWYRENSESVTHPVMQKQPNGYDLYDMIGNVDEWCSSAGDHGRLCCGGSWYYSSEIPHKNSNEVGWRNSALGIRVVYSASNK